MSIGWKEFGQLIREDRERREMTQAEYAAFLGLGKVQGKISQLEAGRIKSPAYEIVQTIKAQLGLTALPGEKTPRAARPVRVAERK